MTIFPKVMESIDDLSPKQIESVLSLSVKLKNHPFPAKSSPFQNTSIVTIFFENSTRTKYSFIQAAWKIGINAIDFPIESSSLAKGESLLENFETLYHQGFSAAVIRTSDSDFFKEFKKYCPLPLLNGGNGMVEHPTQALLDLLTLEQTVGGLDQLKGKKICFVGDTLHSRVFHSHIKLLKHFGLDVSTCGPKEWTENLVPNQNDLDQVIKDNDFLYMLRVQKERHAGKTELSQLGNYVDQFGLSKSRLEKNNKNAKVLHPGPVNIGTELTQDIIDSEYYLGHHQVQYSTWLRASLIAHQLNTHEDRYLLENLKTKEDSYEWPE